MKRLLETNYKIYDYGNGEYCYRFTALSDAGADMEWHGWLRRADHGTYGLFKETIVYGSKDVWWELVKSGIKDKASDPMNTDYVASLAPCDVFC